MKRKITLYLFIVLFNISARCSINMAPPDSSAYKLGALPSAFYMPETRLGFGGLIYSYFKFSKNSPELRKSNTQSYLSYTLNKQFSFENDYQLWLKKNVIYLTGSADFSKFPELFFGIGNDTKKEDGFLISFNIIKINTKNLLMIKKDIYLGFIFHYQNLYNINKDLSNMIECMEMNGHEGYMASGLGPVFIIDKRNNPLNPSKGSYFEASYLDFKHILPNTFSFNSVTVDARKYRTFFNKLVWNGNIYFSYHKGQVPFRMLAQIGGARFLRGYYQGRFRDNNMVIVQHELRMPVYKRIGIAFFGGLGEVAKNLTELKNSTIHYNYGGGLRILLNKKENVNIRIDYGFTKDSKGLYVVYAEAF